MVETTSPRQATWASLAEVRSIFFIIILIGCSNLVTLQPRLYRLPGFVCLDLRQIRSSITSACPRRLLLLWVHWALASFEQHGCQKNAHPAATLFSTALIRNQVQF